MNNTAKKVFNILLKVFSWLLIVFTVFMMVFTIFTVSTVDRNDRSIFGVKFYIVQTDSMSKSENNADLDVHFNAGDIVIIKNVKEPTKLEVGDVISFISMNSESYGKTITHMIREVKKSNDGKVIGYVTYGTNTGVSDEAVVEPSYILGQYAGKLPALGNFFAFVKTTPGYIVCILVPFVLLILYNGINVVRLFRKYRREQAEIMEAEKASIAAERQKNEEMMRELLALKAQLEQKPPEASSATETVDLSEPAVEVESTEEPAPIEESDTSVPEAEEIPAEESAPVEESDTSVPEAEEIPAEESAPVEESVSSESEAQPEAEQEPSENNV